MDESLDGPHQTWVGPQPASTEALPVPPPSHTNYALRPNLASPAERVVQETMTTGNVSRDNCKIVSNRWQKSGQLVEKILLTIV